MKKIVVILLMSVLFLHSIVYFQFNSRSVVADSAQPKYFVDDNFNSSTPGWQDNHFDNIQDAIDKSKANERIIVYDGIYKENIVINKAVSLFGEDVNQVIIDGENEGSVVTITASNVDFSTFTIQNSGNNESDAGIKITSSSENCQIVENKIKNCVYGLFVDRCHNTLFSQNKIFETTNATFFISSDKNTIEYNEVYDNEKHGIFLNQSCEDNLIQKNIIYNNGWYGVYLNDDCLDNTVSENKVYENGNTGIRIEDRVKNTIISENDVTSNSNYGIFVVGSNTDINENTVCEHRKHGIFLFADDSTMVTDNNASDNGLDGIRLQNSTSDVLKDNILINNNRHGVYVNFYSIKNQIYNNYFSGNELNAKDISPDDSQNEWYKSSTMQPNIINGPFIAGNFWGDYEGTDENRDGLGDSPYAISGGEKIDFYPLIYLDPLANAGGPYKGSVFESILFDGSKSVDVNESENLTSYQWSFGDGATKTGKTVRHSFETPGNYTVKITVENKDGGTDTDTTFVIITPDELPPTIEIMTHELVVSDDSTLFIIKANVVDNVEVKNVSLSYWTDNVSNQQTTLMNGKSSEVYEKTVIFSKSIPRVHCVITAVDASENTADTTNPFAVFSCEPIVNVSETIQFDATESFDLDGEITSYQWEFGDGITATGKKSSHQFATDGNYTVSLTIMDNEGNTGLKKQTITVQPSKPLLADNATMKAINDKGILSFDLTEHFQCYDTNGDGLLDMFVDPNGEVEAISVITLNDETTFLLSINDSDIPEFFWQPDAGKIRWIVHVTPTVSEDNVAVDYQSEEATLTIDVDKSGWIWIDVSDTVYPNAEIKTVRDVTNGRSISQDLIWREKDHIYILDDPSTRYHIVFENIFPSIEAEFNPGDSGVIDEFHRTVTISYNVPVSITYASFNGVNVIDNLKTADNKTFTFNPVGYWENGTYTFSIDAEALYGNKVSSETRTYFYFQYELPPQPSFVEKYGLMMVLVGLVLGGGLFYGICRFKGISFDSYVYVKNRRLFPFIKPVIFGPMSVTVEKQNVSKAEFYVDGVLKETLADEPFVWQWNEPGFLNHSVEAKVFDSNGKTMSSGEMSVFIINPFKYNTDLNGESGK